MSSTRARVRDSSTIGFHLPSASVRANRAGAADPKSYAYLLEKVGHHLREMGKPGEWLGLALVVGMIVAFVILEFLRRRITRKILQR